MSRKIEVNYKTPHKLLTPASGFLTGYSHSLNPYAGCSFACSYCYVGQSPIGLFRGQAWGTWIDVKQGIREKLISEIGNLKKRNKQVTIFMSSSTDPYQPLEHKEKVTRALLEAMVEMPPDFLFVQTRSPLVTRDIDLLVKLKDRLRISVTVETDSESIRKKFAPYAPPIQARLKAVSQLRDSLLPVQIAIAPVLPFSSKFPATLFRLVDRVVIDDFYTGDGSNGKRTEKLKVKVLYDEEDLEAWYGENAHLYAKSLLEIVFKPEQILISQEGFLPY